MGDEMGAAHSMEGSNKNGKQNFGLKIQRENTT